MKLNVPIPYRVIAAALLFAAFTVLLPLKLKALLILALAVMIACIPYSRTKAAKLCLISFPIIVALPPANYLPINISMPMLCAVFAFAIYYRFSDDNTETGSSLPFWLLALLIGAFLLSAINAEYPGRTFYQALRFFMGSFIVFYSVYALARTKQYVQWFINASIAVMTVLAILSIIEYFTKSNFIFGHFLGGELDNLKQYVKIHRSYATTALPNVLACLLSGVIPLLFSKLFTSKYRWFYVLLLAVNFVGLIVTFSRMALIVALVTLAIYILMTKNKVKMVYCLIAASMLLFFIIPRMMHTPVADSILYRFDSNNVKNSGSYWHRAYKVKSAELILKRHPVAGIGLGNYPLVSGESKYLSFGDPNALNTFDNQYLQVLGETGFVGFGVFLLLILYILRKLLPLILSVDSDIRHIAIAVLLSIIGFLVNSYILETFMWASLNVWFWALAGLVFALTDISQRALSAKPGEIDALANTEKSLQARTLTV